MGVSECPGRQRPSHIHRIVAQPTRESSESRTLLPVMPRKAVLMLLSLGSNVCPCYSYTPVVTNPLASTWCSRFVHVQVLAMTSADPCNNRPIVPSGGLEFAIHVRLMFLVARIIIVLTRGATTTYDSPSLLIFGRCRACCRRHSTYGGMAWLCGAELPHVLWCWLHVRCPIRTTTC